VTYANVAATIALVVAVSGVAAAAIPGSNGVIHGCYQKKGGSLRVISAARHCPGSQKAIAWNQSGPRGLQGVQGMQGIQGVPGPITGTLPRGVTLRGEYFIRGTATTTDPVQNTEGISFGLSLSAPPTVHYIRVGGTPPAGCQGGTAADPTADPGNACVYEVRAVNAYAGTYDGVNPVNQATVFGFVIYANDNNCVCDYQVGGSWAVTGY
jgi:hypothetical protein